ncbi:MAG: hypothetical protein CMJ49_09050 [Planctomycetaceae bacterium]|nr:hypothetical protein [Planctomycetaceae bacterium]
MMADMQDLPGRRVVVMGLGRFGGGVGVTRYLAEQGAQVLVTDVAPAERLGDALAALEGVAVTYRLGGHEADDFTSADLIVVNPAVDRRGNQFLNAAQAAGVPLSSEMRLLVERLPNRGRVIGVTGTAGKSTVTAMIGHLLQRGSAGEPRGVWVGGNIGGSLLEVVDEIARPDWVVLELSSFMMADLDAIGWSPGVAVVTNISDNHLDRHGTMDAYVAAKQTIVRHQRSGDHAVLGPDAADWPTAAGVGRMVLGAATYADVISLPGGHNQFNAMLAISVGEAIGLGGGEQLRTRLADFPGLAHRLQFVGEVGGVRFFNDSKSTTPASARMAIESFDAGTVHVILGGHDKGADLTDIARLAANRCAGVYTIGATGARVAQLAEAVVGGCPVEACGDVDAAVGRAVRGARAGQVVLLSPACASWDQFENYEQRGARFIELVSAHVQR